LFRLITTFDEVPPQLPRARNRPGDLHRRSVHRTREIYGVDLKRVPPKSRPPQHGHRPSTCVDGTFVTCTRLARTPPSTFLFLPIHLSNSPKPPSPDESRELAEAAPSTQVDDKPPESEELRRRAFPPSGGAPCERHIGSTVRHCQPCILKFFMTSSYATPKGPFGHPATGCGMTAVPLF
jgi:hypothetical protein